MAGSNRHRYGRVTLLAGNWEVSPREPRDVRSQALIRGGHGIGRHYEALFLQKILAAATRQCRFQTRPALNRNPVPENIHGHRDRAVAEFF